MNPTIMRIVSLAVLLLFVHALADFSLQGVTLARAKRRGGVKWFPWPWALFYHSFLHAVGVVLVTNSLFAGMVELVAHAAIDYGKCAGKYGFSVDQGLHIGAKAAIIGLLMKGWL